MNRLNLSPFKRKIAIGSLISVTSLLSAGVLGRYMGWSVHLLPEPSLQEEEEEMKKWSSSLQDPSHKDFNPFKWNNTPDEFGYKK
jgi:hypothetical protein